MGAEELPVHTVGGHSGLAYSIPDSNVLSIAVLNGCHIEIVTGNTNTLDFGIHGAHSLVGCLVACMCVPTRRSKRKHQAVHKATTKKQKRNQKKKKQKKKTKQNTTTSQKQTELQAKK